MSLGIEARPSWSERILRERQERRWSLRAAASFLCAHGGRNVPSRGEVVEEWKRWEAGESEPDAHYKELLAITFGRSQHELFPQKQGETAGVPLGLSLPTDHVLAELAGRIQRDLDGNGSDRDEAWASDLVMQAIAGSGGADNLTSPEPAKISVPAADAIRATGLHLMNLDFRLGGGATRRLLSFYLSTDVLPVLRQDHPGPVRQAIFSAVAELIEILAWSAYDDGHHGAAQYYFVQGIQMTREVGDRALGGTLLGNLSHQANYLNRFDEAVRLARSAQDEAGRQSSSTVRAMLLAMEARGLANRSDERLCTDAIRKAENLLAVDDPAAPVWINYFDEWELLGEAAHCFRDLGRVDQAVEFADQAMRGNTVPERTQGFLTMVSAQATLQANELDHAVDLAMKSMDLVGPLQSNRYIRYVRDFESVLVDRHPDHQLTDLFVERFRGQYPNVPPNERLGSQNGRQRASD